MAWLSRVNFISSDTLSFTDINNLGNDIRAWGDNVNGGGYTLSNVVLSASSGTMATVVGGTGAASTLTIRSTSGTGTSDAIVFQTASQSERMRITSGGNVGIGITSVTSPSRVDIVKSVTAGNLATVRQIRVGVDSNSDYSGYIGYGVGSAGYYALMLQSYHSGVYSNVILSPEGGNVGVGMVDPSYQLQLSTDSAGKPATSTWTIVSDSRLKTVKGEYQKGLAEICQVRPVSYEYNGKAGFVPDGKDKVSILAQELMQVFPECVDTFKGKLEEDGPEIDLYNYNGHAITFALINAIKELKAKIDIVEARN